MSGYPYFVEQLDYLAAVTKALNGLPTTDHVYIHVELREQHTGRPIGSWSDEIAGDCWSYSEKVQT